MRGRSVTGPLILVGIGVLFLISNLRPDFSPFAMFVRYWPFLLIATGVIGLVEVLFYAGRGDETIPRPMGGGWIFWILIWCVVAGVFNGRNNIRFGPWNDMQTGFSSGFFGSSYEYDVNPATMQQVASQGVTRILVDNGRGSISVRGDAAGDVKLTGRKSIRALSRRDADKANDEQRVNMERQGDTLVVRTQNPQRRGAGQVTTDMELSVPRGMIVEVRGVRGDVTVDDIDGSVDVAAARGDVRVTRIGGNTKIEGSRTGLVRVSDAKGSVDLQGRGNDVQLENIAGVVSVNGEYAGDLEFHALAKPMHFQSSRTEFRVEAVPGTINLDLGDLKLTNVTGPVRFSTGTRDIEAVDVTNAIDFTVDRGDIHVTASKGGIPKMDVRSRKGDITVSLPDKTPFQLRASTGQGEAENEFGAPLTSQSKGRGASIEGKTGTGPEINLDTDRGTLSVKKL